MSALTHTDTATVVDQFTNPDWLGATTEQDVRASWLRIKPDTSILSALRDRCTGHVTGWARVLWPISHAKAFACQRFADSHGLLVTTTALSPDLVLQTGEIAADPKLNKRLRAIPQEVLGYKVLRYNPSRRLVCTNGAEVWRITTKRDTGAQLHDFVSGFLPTQARLDTATHPSVSVLEFVGTTDLAAPLSPHQLKTGTAIAAEYLATLHLAAQDLPASLKETLAAKVINPDKQMRAHVSILRAVAPELATRLEQLQLPALRDNAPVLLHGDATADQFLLDEPTGKVWISDLDRAHLGSAATDIGSYLAVLNPALHPVFLQTYGAVAPLPSERDIQVAIAHARLLKLTAPLRSGNPEWRHIISRRLDQVEEVLP